MKHKKTLISLVSLLLLLGIGFIDSAAIEAEKAVSDSLAVQLVHDASILSDSLKMRLTQVHAHENIGDSVDVKVMMMYPAAEDSSPVAESIRKYIQDELYLEAASDLRNGQKLAESSVKKKAEWGKEMGSQLEPYEIYDSIYVVYETEKYITLTHVYNIPFDAEKAGDVSLYSTFCKADGKAIDMSMFSNTESDGFKKLFLRYTRICGKDEDGKQAKESFILYMMRLSSISELDTESLTPYICSRGVGFYYMPEYYVLPYGVIPFDKVKPYLTPSLLELIKN